MALIPMKHLDGAGGYLRWKESVLLRLRTLGVARVLFEDPPAAAGDGGDDTAAKKWARDDTLCRGHILTTLSDRLLPDYARFATAADLWCAIARTYDLEMETHRDWHWQEEFDAFTFDRGTGALLLEQLAHAEALGVAAGLSDNSVAVRLRVKLPEQVRFGIALRNGPDNAMPMGMSLVWRIARGVMARDITPEHLWKSVDEMAEDPDGCSPESPKQEQQSTAYWDRGETGYVVRNCKPRA